MGEKIIKNRHVGERQEEEVDSDLEREVEERFDGGGRETGHIKWERKRRREACWGERYN